MSPRKHIVISGATFAAFIALCSILFVTHLGQPWWNYHSNREIWLAKQYIASKADSPTIWLQGGSATWLGDDSDSIQSETGYNVVNLGFNASFPIDFMLEEVQHYAQPGDIAIISIEYELLWKPKYNTYAVNELSTWNPDYFWSRSLSDKFSYLKKHSWRKVLASNLTRFCKAFGIVDQDTLKQLPVHTLQSNLEKQWQGIYTGEHPTFFNYLDCSPNGDYIYQTEKSWSEGSDYKFADGQTVSPHAIKTLSDFANECHKNKITPCIAWPSIAKNPQLHLESEGIKNTLTRIQETAQKLGYTLLGTPYDYVTEITDFYDTNYHLTAQGRQKRTQTLITKLHEASILKPQTTP